MTLTGRTKTSEPEMQNIPVRAEEGRRIREALREHASALLHLDYEHLEWRLMHMRRG